MAEQVKITKKFLESTPYDDSSTYLVGVKTLSLAKENKSGSPSIIEYCTTDSNCPEIDRVEMEFTKGMDLRQYSGTAEVIDLRLTKEFTENNTDKIIWDSSDMNTNSNAVILSKDSYDGVKYFSKTDTFSIPTSMRTYLLKHTYIDVKCIVYNYSEKVTDRDIFSNCQNIKDLPKLDFKYIPKNIVYSRFKEKKYIFNQENNTSLLYINLPYEYYSKLTIDNEFLAYNINEGYYVGHSNCCESKMNHLCYDIAKNGILKPIQFFLGSKGSITPAWSNKRILSALYLGLPEIPAVIISNNNGIDPRILYKSGGDCTEMLNKYLSPYFIPA